MWPLSQSSLGSIGRRLGLGLEGLVHITAYQNSSFKTQRFVGDFHVVLRNYNMKTCLLQTIVYDNDSDTVCTTVTHTS